MREELNNELVDLDEDFRKLKEDLKDNADILTLLAEMKEDLPESKWDNVLRKAIKETQIEVTQRELAFKELKNYLSMAE